MDEIYDFSGIREHISVDSIPQLNRGQSHEVASICHTDVQTARAAITMSNGDLNAAINRLLSLDITSPVDELVQLGGISRQEAESYLSRVNGNLSEAVNLLVQEMDKNLPPSPMVASTCPCCFDSFSNTEPVTLQNCFHSFCSTCLQSWINVESQSSSTGKVRCPLVNKCTEFLSPFELKALSDPVQYQRLERRALELSVASDPTFHLCRSPDCTFITSWTPDDGPPHLICPLCNTERCLACNQSPYHVEMTCAEALEHRHRSRVTRSMVRPPTSSMTTTSSLPLLPPLPGGNFSGLMTANSDRVEDVAIHSDDPEEETRKYMLTSGIRVCKQCGNGVTKSSGCNKMKCRCGYRFCYECGTENARCGCTPAEHGFIDNVTGRGDFSNL